MFNRQESIFNILHVFCLTDFVATDMQLGDCRKSNGGPTEAKE